MDVYRVFVDKVGHKIYGNNDIHIIRIYTIQKGTMHSPKIVIFSIHFCTKVFQNDTEMDPGSDVITTNSTNNVHDNYKGKIGLVLMFWYMITVLI